MASNVETMFSVRKKPWHGLGTIINEAPSSEEALRYAGLDWQVYQQDLVTNSGLDVLGYKANIRNSDNRVLGVVTDRYKVVQNQEAFRFTDELLGRGVRYEAAGDVILAEKYMSELGKEIYELQKSSLSERKVMVIMNKILYIENMHII